MNIIEAVLVIFIVCIVFLAIPTPFWPSWFFLLFKTMSLPMKYKQRLASVKYLLSLASYSPLSYILYFIDILAILLLRCRHGNSLGGPIFIVGTPRSGSTLLHRLLVESSHQFTGITHLEWRYPSFVLQYIMQITGLKQWLSRSSYWDESDLVASTASKMHPNLLGDYEEDAILFEERLGHHPYVYLHFPFNGFLSRFATSGISHNRLYRLRDSIFIAYYKHVLRCISLIRPAGARFVSKEVASNSRLPSLLKAFPDSKVIVITRHPSDYLSSLKPLLVLSTIAKTQCNESSLGSSWWNHWLEWLSSEANAIARIYNNMNSGTICHVEFRDLIKDPEKVLSTILEFTGADKSPDFDSFIKSHCDSQSRRSRGYSYETVSYDPGMYKHFLDTFYPSVP